MTIALAANVLSEHKLLDFKWQTVNIRDCRTDSQGTIFAQQPAKDLSHIICNCCGERGHYSNSSTNGCPKIDTIAPNKWHKPKKLADTQAAVSEDTEQSGARC
jgi:hypothetical protein